MEPKELFADHYLFRDLPQEAIDQISVMGFVRKHDPGEVIFLKGDPGDALYGVLQGEIRITSTSISGRETVLNNMGVGEIFGEIALLDGHPRTADAIAGKNAITVSISRKQFFPFLEQDHKVQVHMIELLCSRLRWVSERVEDFSFLDVPGRLAKLLLAQHNLKEGESSFRLPPQGEIAKMIGTSRVSVNRNFQQWKKDGLIETDDGRYRVLDEDGLEDFLYSDE